jgi:hypothetical protein
MSLRQEPPTETVLEIVAISDHEWCVCDGRLRTSDARRMLGFIDKTAGTYELVRLQPWLQFERFSTLDDALEALHPSTAGEVTR